MARLIQEMLPRDMICSKETRDLLTECCLGNFLHISPPSFYYLHVVIYSSCLSQLEFIEMIAAEANEICENEKKKTIVGEHVLGALEKLGFEDCAPEVRHILNEYQSYLKVRGICKNKTRHDLLPSKLFLNRRKRNDVIQKWFIQDYRRKNCSVNNRPYLYKPD
jgi:hypothetical protein